MKNVVDLFNDAMDHWRDAKGIGTALIPAPLNDKAIVLGILQRVYTRSPTCKTVIITTTFNERSNIIEFLTQQENEDENNQEFKELIDKGLIKILTYNFIRDTNPNMYPLLCILYHPEEVCDNLVNLINRCKFKLVVLNKIISNIETANTLYKLAPMLNDFKQNEIDEIRTSSPVEEIQIGVSIPEDSEDFKLLKYYNEYISTSVSIFGSFDIMQQANVGNNQLNISSAQICYQIAQENGWTPQLDMSIPFNIEIDKLYNPISLKERASKTYEIIRNRSQLLSDYNGKFDEILNIIKNNSDKKILIINKRADFASKVTEYINNLSETNICMNYHDKIDNIPAIDDEGNPIYYKSGLKKGERKMMGCKAQKTLAETLFNKGKINILSTNNSPDKDLNIDVDIIIITSPMCEDIKSYMYRLSKVCFRMNKIILYTLYIKNTMEQKSIEIKDRATNHNVKNNSTDEINFDFVVAD